MDTKKLSYVEFKQPQKFENQTVTAISDDKYGALLLDGFQVYVGKHGFPITEVKRWLAKPSEEEAICPECSESFVDARGLGAHRWFKHQVKGKR